MRHLYIILDTSKAMAEADLKPSRLICSIKVKNHFELVFKSTYFTTESGFKQVFIIY